MATATKSKKIKTVNDDRDAALKKYEELFEQLTRFTTSITNQEEEITKAKLDVEEAKLAFEEARDKLRELENARDGAKHSLYRFLSPANGQIMPLFDTMDEADEEVHGKNSTEWRKEPIAALKISLPSLKALTDADIVMVGQLQDRVLDNPQKWWESVAPLNAGTAAAITDRLNNFIFERTQR